MTTKATPVATRLPEIFESDLGPSADRKTYVGEWGVTATDLGAVSYTHLTLPTKRIV